MRRPVSKLQIRDYLSARARAHRFIRDSSPPLTKKGLAQRLKLEPSAFNKFVNGTIFVDADGDGLSVAELTGDVDVYLREKWTEKRLVRFVSRVETECWTLGIVHKPNPTIRSAARNEIEQLRLSKYFQYLGDIKNSANLSVDSAFTFWNVCAQEAQDARDHLRPTMCVNALYALGDIVDRREDGQLCGLQLARSGRRSQLEMTLETADDLMSLVFHATGEPCRATTDSKTHECYHKSHGYGGYDKFFLGLGLESRELQATGVEHLLSAVQAEHHRNDGHFANTATVLELAFRLEDARAKTWALWFRELVCKRLDADADLSVCYRLVDMNIPSVREVLGTSLWGQLESRSRRVPSAALNRWPSTNEKEVESATSTSATGRST